VAVFKLSAVVIGTIGVMLTLGVMLLLIPFFGGLLFLATPFIAYYTLLGAMFDLDSSDCTFTCVIMLIVWIGFNFFIAPMLM
jgi:hypothetical protein